MVASNFLRAVFVWTWPVFSVKRRSVNIGPRQTRSCILRDAVKTLLTQQNWDDENIVVNYIDWRQLIGRFLRIEKDLFRMKLSQMLASNERQIWLNAISLSSTSQKCKGNGLLSVVGNCNLTWLSMNFITNLLIARYDQTSSKHVDPAYKVERFRAQSTRPHSLRRERR